MMGYPSQEEKGSFGAVSFEKIQDFASIFNHSRGPTLPRASRDILSEGFHLEVILDIYTQYMSYAQTFFGRACGIQIVQRLFPVFQILEWSRPPKACIHLPGTPIVLGLAVVEVRTEGC